VRGEDKANNNYCCRCAHAAHETSSRQVWAAWRVSYARRERFILAQSNASEDSTIQTEEDAAGATLTRAQVATNVMHRYIALHLLAWNPQSLTELFESNGSSCVMAEVRRMVDQ
jgi:hypothetical protein